MIEILLFIILIFLVSFLFKKKNLLLNFTGQSHQIFNQEYQVPLIGGLFILIYFFYNFQYFEIILIFYLSAFFLLGFLTDLNFIKSPTFRFFLQILFLLLFIINLNITIYDVRIEWINRLLENNHFNTFFVLFCFLVLINGSNFIDGNNGISLGYFLIIFLLILNLINKELVFYEVIFITSFISILLILLIFNLFNRLYLGDSGVYILSLFTGYIVIDLFSQNLNISPYFVANIFWYPAFEILFSLIRKIKSRYSPLIPDTIHFHQLLFLYYLRKINFNKSTLNSITGLTINLYNGIILYFASLNIFNTKMQVLIISFSVVLYLLIYYFLLNYKNLSFKK